MKNNAWIFPGQGSQSVGMGKTWFEAYPLARSYLDRADRRLGFSLTDVMFHRDEAELTKTFHAQPAILTLSVAISAVLRSLGFQEPVILAGHSLGEYSALVVSGALSFEDAVDLVYWRGKYMQEAVPQGLGTMSAILGLEDHIVEEVCASASTSEEKVEPANYNCPGQLVISGHVAAVDRAEVFLKEKGAKRCIRLQVSAPFHSSLLKPAGEKLYEKLQTVSISAPNIPYVSNVDVEMVSQREKIADKLAQQVWKPVRWTQSVIKIHEVFQPQWIEIGAGKTLQSLVKKSTPPDTRILTSNSFDDLSSLTKPIDQSAQVQ